MIKVVQPGIYCSVQDLGRLGFANKGIPQAGVMDAFSVELGNVLLQNSKEEAVLEITFGQGKFEFTSETLICITGGDFSAKINGNSAEMNKVLAVKKGAVLSFGQRIYGARVYVAIQGGIQTELILGSRSFFPGITPQRLTKNELLPIQHTQGESKRGFSKVKVFQEHFNTSELVCFPGPEFDQLNVQQKVELEQIFSISEDNNRMGYRLNEPIENDLKPILTSAVLPGTVQLTPSGTLIVLMRDAQVTGGYPRVLQLSDYAVSKLSQKVAGEKVRFSLYSDQ